MTAGEDGGGWKGSRSLGIKCILRGTGRNRGLLKTGKSRKNRPSVIQSGYKRHDNRKTQLLPGGRGKMAL